MTTEKRILEELLKIQKENNLSDVTICYFQEYCLFMIMMSNIGLNPNSLIRNTRQL